MAGIGHEAGFQPLTRSRDGPARASADWPRVALFRDKAGMNRPPGLLAGVRTDAAGAAAEPRETAFGRGFRRTRADRRHAAGPDGIDAVAFVLEARMRMITGPFPVEVPAARVREMIAEARRDASSR